MDEIANNLRSLKMPGMAHFWTSLQETRRYDDLSLKDGLLMTSTGSMGQEKIETNPLVIQLPKYNDTANKTLGVMLDIIQRLGTAAPAGDKLGEFLSE